MVASNPNTLRQGLPLKSVISLPNTPSQLPEHLICSQSFTRVDVSLASARECLSQITEPNVIVSSSSTPVNWWLAAQMLFPTVDKYLYQDDGQWLKITENDFLRVQDVQVKATDNQQHKSIEKVAPRRINSKSTPGNSKPEVNDTSNQNKIKKLVWDTFTAFIWNKTSPEDLYQKYLRQASDIGPYAEQKVEDAARDGRQAVKLQKILVNKYALGENEKEIAAWIDKESGSQSSRVIKALRKNLSDKSNFSKAKNALRTKDQNFNITLPYTVIEGNFHPQSLRSLSPSRYWEIYIDETGKEFTGQAKVLNETDKNLGRIIALVMPESHELPKPDNETHAVDLPLADIQKLLSTLTKNNIGILGATLKADIQSHSWIAAITKLMRWTLLMLPMNGHTEVVFKIENRSDYKDSTTLKALEETLVDELRQLAPERFKELKLSLELVGKNAPYNGYVDVIANCWGSADNTKRRLLARTQWRGHCLLQTTDLADADRLYQEAGSADMDADTWFRICVHLAKEPGYSLFHDLLEKQGESAQCNAALWQKYLKEVQHRIAIKNFDTGSLGRALTWLNQFQPDNECLPGLLQLRLKSVQLAVANHQGRCDIPHVKQTMTLASKLKDESASDACEAALRIAISATNSFDFTNAVPFIKKWVSEPIAVPGLLNHGKLLSTLGQLCAFRGEYEQAIQYFDDAIEYFDKLSDHTQADRNKQQTNIYKTVVQLDLDASEAKESVYEIVDRATGKTGAVSIRQLSRSTSFRFEHYLLLRCLICHTEQTQERYDYLSSSDDWQEGEGHPWMLINAYRAWLLADSNRSDEAASYLQKAVDDCSDSESGAILHWMAHCLHALGESLGLIVERPAQACPSAPFPSGDLAGLRDATTNQSRIQALSTLLPFNFH